MSTRWYPLYQRGNPQLRVFLPNFWLKLVRPQHKQPDNIAQFHCSMEMTRHDVQNYLQKLYNVPVVDVRTRIQMGRMRRDPGKGYVVKDDDIKIAYVTMPRSVKFTFPELIDPTKEEEKKDEGLESLDEAKKGFRNYLERNKNRPGLPSWFSI